MPNPAPRLKVHGNGLPAEFGNAVFPEWAFPPVNDRTADYLAACRRGYATMARSRVAITGLARDIGGILPATIRRLGHLGRCFADHRVIVYENDSADDTPRHLHAWAKSDRRVQVISERRGDPVNPQSRCLNRAGRMARYRSRCHELVLSACGHFDAVIVVDLDLLGGWSTDGLAHTFGQSDWDFVGANGIIYRRAGLRMNAARQYDTWALRFDERLTPLTSAVAGGFLRQRGEPLVAVTSCFGGLGVYRMDAYRAGRYAADDLEHATFHRSLRDAGHGRLFLNPSQIVVYGRRRRFGDALAHAVVRSWEAVVGRRTPQGRRYAWNVPGTATPIRPAAA